MLSNDKFGHGYSFNDLAIIPRIPKCSHQKVNITSKLADYLSLRKPFIASPMDTVMNAECGIALAQNGAMGILHYNYNCLQEQIEEVKRVKDTTVYDSQIASVVDGKLCVGALIKTDLDLLPHVENLICAGVDLIALDTLHSSPHLHIPMVRKIKAHFPDVLIMSGNIVHPNDCIQLIEVGVDCLRIGYSAGSINDGKSIFGHARSQACAISECSKISHEYKIPIVADGGIRTTGDISIAFALGADFIMAGKLFSCSTEAPGEVTIDQNGRKLKKYKGMSRHLLTDPDTPPEGVETLVCVKESTMQIIDRFANRLQIAIARAGSVSLDDFKIKCELEILTNSSILETRTS